MATLRAMERRGDVNPDVGYWAERWDPDGSLHPLYYTSHLDGKWVNVTTLPALYAAYPLFKVAGYRGALLVPMVGAVVAALGARSLARRLGGGQGWAAFWIVGLASPLTVYALDFWEHSWGVALVAWAVVALLRVASGDGRWYLGLAAGLLFGTAATMRTESLVYGAVATAACGGALLWRRRRRGLLPALLVGAAVVVGLVIPLLANTALEKATIGTSLRAERAAGTVRGAVAGAGETRMEEALLTSLGLDSIFSVSNYLVGAALLGLLLLVARRSKNPQDARVVWLGAAGVAALYLLRFAAGLGFIPGLIPTTPLAAVALAWAWPGGPRVRATQAGQSVRATQAGHGVGATQGGHGVGATQGGHGVGATQAGHGVGATQGGHGVGATQAGTARLVAIIAVAALPLVWAFQYTGGAGPQWAGRYILVSGFLLGVVGVCSLAPLRRWVAVGLVALAGAVTAFGLVNLSTRSHDVARSSAALVRRPTPALVSRIAHLFREGGWYVGGQRWLTAVDDDQVPEAAEVVRLAGLDGFELVELDEGAVPTSVPGFVLAGVERLRFIGGDQLRITTYVRAA